MDIEIYKDYSPEDILLDEPCYILGCGDIYPVRVKDKNKLYKYIDYITVSIQHMGGTNDEDLLKLLINTHILKNDDYSEEILQNTEALQFYFYKSISDLEELFSIVTRKTVKFDEQESNNQGVFIFTSEDKTVFITDSNFNDVRKVILKQNLLHEPKIYKNEITQKWAEKALKARKKNNPSTEFYDVLNIVSCENNVPYSVIKNEMSIFQVYADYFRLCNSKQYDRATLFKSAYKFDEKSIPNISFNDGVIEQLFKSPYEGLFVDGNSLGVNKILKEK